MKFSTRKIHIPEIPINRGIYYRSRFTEGVRAFDESGGEISIPENPGFWWLTARYFEVTRPETAIALRSMAHRLPMVYGHRFPVEAGKYFFCEQEDQWVDVMFLLQEYARINGIFNS